ncbi:MAG: outer membrane beta-barrel protein [Bacteroidota bacterium]|nr:outer membrane beta-barrel protein [Bacteroidota bacterium]
MRNYTTLLLLLLLLLFASVASAQSLSVQGTVVQSGSGKPLLNANVILLDLPDSSAVRGAVTGRDGGFMLDRIRPGSYLLKITYIGYDKVILPVVLDRRPLDFGEIPMRETSIPLGEVEVTGRAPLATLKGDTSEFHAQAYKLNPDATAEDLVRKMPGIVVKDGTVEAQGEEVKEVLVDKKPFFGDDPRAVLRNVPAEMIDRIQVFDKQSEQSQFSGFSDGNETKTINIVTRSAMRNAQFGKVYGGYGENEYYRSGFSLNLFNDQQRWTLLGMSNNVNEQNFASEDLLGVMSSSGRGFRGMGGRGGPPGGGGGGMRPPGMGGDVNDFLVNTQSGIARTHAFGVNYIDNWGGAVDVAGSYFFNYSDNEAGTALFRDYVLPEAAGQFYSENENAGTTNMNHRLNMRLDWSIDSVNSILLRPRLSLQQNEGQRFTTAGTTVNGAALNSSATDFASDLTGLQFSNQLLYRRRFQTPGRSFSWEIENEYTRNSGDNSLYSDFTTFGQSAVADTLDQRAELLRDGWSVESSLRYTEPVSRVTQLMLRHDASYSENTSDRQTWDRGLLFGDEQFNSTLSNVFANQYLTQSASAGVNYEEGPLDLIASVGYQWATLQNDQRFPQQGRLDRSFGNLVPFARLRWKISRSKNLNVFYRSRTSPPSVEQLQDVLDNSNPLLLQMGNPNLDQSAMHFAGLRYSSTDVENSSYFFAFAAASTTQDYIGTHSIFAARDSTVFGIPLAAGTQLSRPENLDGQYSLRGFMTYGRPVNILKSNLNMNFTASATNTPGRINGTENNSLSQSTGIGAVLSSNISPDFDFTLSTDASYTWVDNSIGSAFSSEYYSQSTRLRFNWIMWADFVFNTDLAHQHYSGLSDDFDEDYLLWNVSLGKKMLPDDRGEIRLTVYDVLGQNSSIQRSVTDAYIEDTRSNVIQRYVLLSFTWNLRHFAI